MYLVKDLVYTEHISDKCSSSSTENVWTQL